MGTVNKQIADEVIKHNGLYQGDRIIKVVQYNNQFDGALAYGLIHQGEDPMRYHRSPACHNPVTLWEKK